MNQKYKYERIHFKQKQQRSNINILRYIAQFLVYSTTKTLKNTSIAPFQVIKIILQTQKHLSQNIMNKQIISQSQIAKKCIKQQGIQSLWRGNLLQAIQVYINQLIITLMKIFIKMKKEKLENDINHKFRTLLWAICNILEKMTTIISYFICYPLKMLRIKLISQIFNKNKQKIGIISLFDNIYQKQGVKEFYRGALLSFFKQNIEAGLLKILKYIKSALITKIPKLRNLDPWEQFLCQKFIQLVVKIIFYPFEIMINISIVKGKNTASIVQLLKNLTINKLFKGINIEILSFLFSTFVLIIYDNFKSQKLIQKNQ